MPLDNKIIHLYDEVEAKTLIIDHGDYRLGLFLARNNQKTTEENEDSVFFVASDKKILAGVADGAGGHPRGRDAAFHIGKSITESKIKGFHRLIEQANDEVINLKVGAKATLSLVTIVEDDLRIFNVGDSEVLHWNGGARLIFTTTPNSVTGHMVKAGEMDQLESLDHEDRYGVFSLLGDEFVNVESTTKMSLKKGHTVIVGSDGLFDNISHDKLSEIVATGLFEKSFEDLTRICSEQDEDTWRKHDDISFILIRKIKSD